MTDLTFVSSQVSAHSGGTWARAATLTLLGSRARRLSVFPHLHTQSQNPQNPAEGTAGKSQVPIRAHPAPHTTQYSVSPMLLFSLVFQYLLP